MATGATGQLGLALPVQGELTGTWGNTVNNAITEYTNIAIAATLTLTNDGAVTLANTTGTDLATNIVSSLTGAGTVTAQFAIVRVTGTLTTAKVVTGPSYSKTYVVDNAATGDVVTFKASGQTGVSVAVGEKCTVYFNGTDYVKVASSTADGVTTFSAGTTGFTPSTATSGAVTLSGTLAIANGGTGTTSTTFANLTTNVTGTLPTTNGGTGLTSFTSGGVVYASSGSALATGSGLLFDGTNLGVGLTPTGQSRVHVYTGNNAVNGVQTQFNASNFPIALASSTSGGFPYLGVNTVQKTSSDTQTYAINGFASRLSASGGGFQFSTAASGTAGNDITFTSAMTLDASGRLGLGITSPSYTQQIQSATTSAGATPAFNLVINRQNSATEGLFLGMDGNNDAVIASNNAALRFGTVVTGTFGEKARIDSVGNVLVGGTAARGTTAGTAHLDLFNGTAPAGTLTNGVSLYSSSGDLKFMDAAGNAYSVGYRSIPPVGTKTSSYTLATGDVGKYVQVGSGGSIVVPDSVFSEGDAISIFNNTSGNITITLNITTAYIAGTDTDKNSVTLATRGVANILFISGTICVVTGNVS